VPLLASGVDAGRTGLLQFSIFERRQIPENCRHGLGYGRLKQISTDNMSFRDIFSSSFERQLSPAQQSTFLLIEIPVPAGKTTINP